MDGQQVQKDNLTYHPTTLPPTKGETMVGTLWKSKSGIAVCTKCGDGFYTMRYLDALDCFTYISESTLHFYYTQLTQPQEET